MAKVHDSLSMLGLSGSIGDLVFRRMPDGSTRVSRKPDFSKRQFSQGQLDAQARFKRATAYAREASKTQPVYAEFSKGKMTNAYNLALSDYLKPPVVHSIERRNGRVHIVASDNIMVTEVHVKIMGSDGNTLEEGQAERADSFPDTQLWEFHSTNAEGTIEATACDLAGNQTKAVLQNKAS